jgi:hypothetical protein
MFKVTKNQTFTHPVKVRTPIDGGYLDETFKATFNLISTEEANGFDRTTEGTTLFLRRVLVRCDDLVDEAKQPLPWSDDLRDHLIFLPHVRIALWRAYEEAIANNPKAGN